MNLIRNGGFETGDTRFWDMTAGVSFEADPLEQKYGTYSGLLSMTNVTGGSVQSGDYLEVEPYQILDFSAQILPNGFDTIYIYVREYTEDLSFIRNRTLWTGTPAAAWLNVASQIRLGGEVCYVQLRFYVEVNATPSEFNIDSVILNKVDMRQIPTKTVELCNLSNLTASGDTTDVLKDLYGFSTYYADIDITSLTGTTPTLDVEICEYDAYGNERVLGNFSQFDGAGDQRVGVAPPVTGDIYVKYTEGGTWTDCDFRVTLIGVR